MKSGLRFVNCFIILSSLLLVGCTDDSSKDEFSTYIATPSGAPTLALSSLINNGKVETISTPSNIPSLFSKGDLPFIVFDSINAQNILEKQGDKAKYKFEMMLTGGNFHLLGFNKEKTSSIPVITTKDNVLGFQQNKTPDILFRSIFGDNLVDDYKEDISTLKQKLLSMNDNYEIDNNVVDYAIVAEPVSTVVTNTLSKKNLHIVDYNLQDIFQEKHNNVWSKKYIPQAGLYVRKDISVDDDVYKTVINEVKSSIKEATSNASNVKKDIEEVYKTEEEQTSHYGFPSKIVITVQGQNGEKNGFGLVPNDVDFTVNDINLFSSIIK